MYCRDIHLLENSFDVNSVASDGCGDGDLPHHCGDDDLPHNCGGRYDDHYNGHCNDRYDGHFVGHCNDQCNEDCHCSGHRNGHYIGHLYDLTHLNPIEKLASAQVSWVECVDLPFGYS